MQEIKGKEKKDDDQHMEISWEPALSENAEQLVKNKIEKEEEKSMTPWEKYLKGKKKKSKEKAGQRYKESLALNIILRISGPTKLILINSCLQYWEFFPQIY